MHGSWGRRALPLLPLLLLAASGPAGALMEEERQAVLLLHNLYRAQVSPPAADMRRMSWDAELAAFAQAYAHRCVWGHNAARGRRGENLFAITDEGLDVPLAMEEWFHEREHYNLSAAACAPGQVCGHYTQLVWSRTERIGCGAHFCEQLQGVEETNVHLLVCNYEPPGNVKGKRPYQEGTPCSQCPPGYGCKTSLCEPIEGPEDAQDLPFTGTEAPSTSTRAAAASGSGRAGAASPATAARSSSATEASGAPVTTVPSSAPTQLSSLATEARPSLASGGPLGGSTHHPLSRDGGPVLPQPTHVPVPEYADGADNGTRATSVSPEPALYPKTPATGTRGPLPSAQEEAEVEAPASVSPAEHSSDELQASRGRAGRTPPDAPKAPASTNATGGRVLALQSSLPGAEGPGRDPRAKASGPVWGPPLGLLLLPPLLWAATL